MEQTPGKNAASIPVLQYQQVYTLPITKDSSTPSPLLRALAFSPDGRYFAGAFDRYVTIWRSKESQEGEEDTEEKWTQIFDFRIDDRSASEEITCLSWMPTGHILIGSNIGDVKIILLRDDDTLVRGFQSSTHPVRFVTLDRTGRLLAVVSGQHKIGIWQWIDSQECWSRVHSLPPPEKRLASDDAVEVTSIHWERSGQSTLIISYLNHGILYGGSLSPDGQHFAIPNRKGTFDIYNLSSRDKLDWLHDPDLQEAQKHVGLRSRPGVFIHGGLYFVGASIGKVNIWNTARSIRGQRLSLEDGFENSPVTLLTVSNTDGTQPIDSYRIAACTQGPKQVIQVWKASGRGYVPSVSVAERSVPSHPPTTGPSTLVTGMLIGGLAVHAASTAYMGLF
ncbi:hypothetical protein MD484_g8781, partial [Candolleomyces efflorescens]